MKQTACVHLGIGLDTARYAHHVSFLDEKKRTAAKAFHFTETADGYRKFRQALDRPAEKHPHLHLTRHGSQIAHLLIGRSLSSYRFRSAPSTPHRRTREKRKESLIGW